MVAEACGGERGQRPCRTGGGASTAMLPTAGALAPAAKASTLLGLTCACAIDSSFAAISSAAWFGLGLGSGLGSGFGLRLALGVGFGQVEG